MNTNERQVGLLKVFMYPDRSAMGSNAAKMAGDALRALLKEKDEVNLIFAAAPSQSEFLDALCKEEGIDWSRANAFHMDEYVGLAVGQEGSFTNFLNLAVFDRLPFKNVYRINGAALVPEEECVRYTQLLKEHPVDIVFMGVGENGHIAFNDPPVANFNDNATIKIVQLDDVCRMQQVHDKCFPTFDDVPKRAYTLTVPTLFSAKQLFCIVPGQTKAAAIKRMLLGEIVEACPASILRRHEDAKLFVDADSAKDYLFS